MELNKIFSKKLPKRDDLSRYFLKYEEYCMLTVKEVSYVP